MSSYAKLIQDNNVVVGTKQTLRLVEQGKAVEVFIAKNTDPSLSQRLIRLCQEHEIKVTYVDSMKELGKACGIDVGAAMAAIIDEQ